MDREKQKKLERERMEKERAKMPKDDGKEHEAEEEGDGPRVPRKSKFVSNPYLALTAKWFLLAKQDAVDMSCVGDEKTSKVNCFLWHV